MLKKVTVKNFNDDSIKKLYKNIFNYENFSNILDDNEISIFKQNLSSNDITKNEYNSFKENSFSFPLILKRLKNSFFDNKENIIYNIFKENECVDINPDLDSLENMYTLYLFYFDTNGSSIKFPRDVLNFDCIIKTEKIPSFKIPLNNGNFIMIKKEFSRVFKITSTNEKKDDIIPKQYVKGIGFTNCVYKTNKNRIIISCKVYN